MTDGVSSRRFVLMATGAGSVGVAETGVVCLVVGMATPLFVDGLDFVTCGFGSLRCASQTFTDCVLTDSVRLGSGCFKLHLHAVWTEGA